MTYAPLETYHDDTERGIPRALGSFKVYQCPTGYFEYSERPSFDRGGWASSHPHLIYTIDGNRAATIRSTVAYVVTDEDEFGNPVVEKWKITHHRKWR